jgi:hypothetical protein
VRLAVGIFCCFLICSLAQGEDSLPKSDPVDAPTIGSAAMEENGDIVLTLRAAAGNSGIVGDAQLRYKPGDPEYMDVLQHLGGLEPGESKLVPPWPDKPEQDGQ